MTKKHFIALANDIKHSRTMFMPTHLEVLADLCHSQNSNFNRERWLSFIAGTCGSNGGTIKPLSKPRYITLERKLARRLEGK